MNEECVRQNDDSGLSTSARLARHWKIEKDAVGERGRGRRRVSGFSERDSFRRDER